MNQHFKDGQTIEEWCLGNIGCELYNLLIRDYTIKHWKQDPKNLPASIIKRLPIKFNYNNNYFNDKYQGIPIYGYTNLIKNMLDNPLIHIKLSTALPKNWEKYSHKLIYSGRPDVLLNYEYGDLPYLSMRFDHIWYDQNQQGISVLNHTDMSKQYTRTIESKYFMNNTDGVSVVSYEYPQKWDNNLEPYYPLVDEVAQNRYQKYKNAIESNNSIILGGRLGSYKYYDMHQVIGEALRISERILK